MIIKNIEMRPLIFTFIASLSCLMLNSQPAYNLETDTIVPLAELKAKFLEPPAESRLRCYWWWLNSMATPESITRDLEEMKAKGYGGAAIIDAGSSNYQIARKTPRGPVFLSDEWLELYKHAVREADRLDIELSVNVLSGWNPGAPSITPEMALKKMVYSETTIKGGKRVVIELPKPDTTLIYSDVMVQAFPAQPAGSKIKNEAIPFWSKKSFNEAMGWKGVYPLFQLREGFDLLPDSVQVIRQSDIIDLTAQFDGKKLEWDAPAGDWTVIRYGWTCTGARVSTSSDDWTGLSLDHLNPDAFELFRKTTIQPLIDAAKSAGNSVKYLQTDSWEMGTVNWTNRFPEEFKRFRGYDMQLFMPVMTGRVVESPESSNRFLFDIRRTVSDCVIENHYRLFAELARKYGMDIHPESGGPHSAPVDALQTMALGAFPQGEFWATSNTHRTSDADRLAVKQSACVAHTNGKRFVAGEGPTSIGPQWERSPRELKANIDRVFCSGLNRIEWHTFTSSPQEFGTPGNEYFAGTHLNPNVTWWSQAGDFINYLNRCAYMLQQGVFVADVLYYYGDDVPNFVFLKEEFPELHFGYDWDKCSKDVILNRLSVRDGQIVLPDGMRYRLLYLPPERSLNIDVMRRLESLVGQGMTLVGSKPDAATGLSGFPESDRELKAIADRMWGDDLSKNDRQYGRGRVVWGTDLNEILSGMGVEPDFSFKSPDAATALDYIHRHTAESEIYFVVNRFAWRGINDFNYIYRTDLPDRYETVEARFRVTGKTPWFWNPQTGEMRPVDEYRMENGQTVIRMDFAPEESVFVVFTNEKAVTNKKLSAPKPKEIPVDGDWNVTFAPEWGGLGRTVFKELKSWTESDDERIKYYSGTAVYTKKITIQEKYVKGKAILDLGNLQDMAAVKLNGHRFTLLWTPPYKLDVTKYLINGENTLEIEVVNLWPNRLIGDGKLPPDKRITKTNINKFDAPDAEKLLRVSGLLGPVKLIIDK
jgi:hypothetical protein